MEGEFAHYGVKGMKWGVRKEYVPHPRKTSGKSKRSKTKKKLTDAEKAARNRKIALGLIAGAAGVMVGSALYSQYKMNGKRYFDTVVKAGTAFQRLTSKPDEKLSRIYAVYKRNDKTLYKARLGALQKRWNGKTFVKTYSAIKEIRAPSDKKSEQFLKNLMDTDSEFRDYVKGLKNYNFKRLNRHPETISDFYKNFNLAGLMDRDASGQKQVQKFYDLLKKNGYNAVTDLNDRKFSTFKANNPVIVFDMGNLVERTVRELHNQEIADAKKVYDLATNGAQYLATMLGISGAVLYSTNTKSAGKSLPNYQVERSDNEKKVKHSDDIYHYGVKGMKWGVRKARPISFFTKKPKKRKYEDLTNEELQKRITRMNLEKQYEQLNRERNTPKHVKVAQNIGKKFVDQAVVGVAVTGATAISKPYVEKLLRKLEEEIKNHVVHSDDIYHYGVKGMKWGVRKEYEPHPRKAAKKSPDLKKKGRKKLTAEQKKKVAMALIGAGLAAGVGVAGYHAYRVYGKNYFDTVVKAGKEFQRITTNPNEKLDRLYAAYGARDKARYKGMYGNQMRMMAGSANNIRARKFSFSDTIRAPSMKKASAIMNDLMSNDAEFKSYVEELNRIYGSYINGKKANAYEIFNAYGVMNRGEYSKKNMSKFYDAVKKAGYNAIVDMNDVKFSGYRAGNPLIVLDPKSITKETVEKLDDDKINKALVNVAARDLGEVYVPVLMATTGMKMYANAASEEKKEKWQKEQEGKRKNG